MKRRWILVLLILVTLPLPVSAGIIFGKKTTKPEPRERVPELIKILMSDGDENKRADAADELRQYDPAQFPDIVPTLIDAMLNDKKPAVRSEAAHSIGKIRPISQMAGRALEKVLADDTSMRVRMQARSAMLSYQWAGYRSNGKKDDPLATTKEPPLADPQGLGPMLNPPTIIPARMTPIPQEGPALPPIDTRPAPGAKPEEPKGPDLN